MQGQDQNEIKTITAQVE